MRKQTEHIGHVAGPDGIELHVTADHGGIRIGRATIDRAQWAELRALGDEAFEVAAGQDDGDD